MSSQVGIRVGSLAKHYSKKENTDGETIFLDRESGESMQCTQKYVPLGTGPHGRVYVVYEPTTGRDFACKEIQVDAYNQQHQAALFRCVEIQLKLSHPNINSPVDAVYDQGSLRLYIISPLLRHSNGSFSTNGSEVGSRGSILGHHEPMNEERIWAVVRQIVDALKYLHSGPLGTGPIAHTALKSSNIYLGSDGDVKLMDVGMSSSLCRDILMDTMGYMSNDWYKAPEQLEKDEHGAEFEPGVLMSSDIWALGCYLYELIFRKRPFTKRHDADLFLSITRMPRPIELPTRQISCRDGSPILQNPGEPLFSENLKNVLNGCLTVDPAARPTLDEIAAIARQTK